MGRCRRTRAALLAGLTLAASQATASGVDREGFFVGGGVGVGWIACDPCDSLSGLSAGFHAGWMLGKRWAVVLDGGAVITTPTADALQVTSGIGGIGARFFLGERVWIQAVVGSGGLDTLLSSALVEKDDGAALMGGVGVELLQRGSFVLDLAGRVGGFEDENGRVTNFSIQLGVNWY